MSGLAAVSGHLARVPHLQVLLAWDPIACRDVGWLTLVSREVVGVAATLGDLGLTLRDYSMEAGGWGELEELIHDIMAVIRDRGPWRVELAWDSATNRDVGWLTSPPATISSPSPAASLQLRRWNLAPPRVARRSEAVARSSTMVRPPSLAAAMDLAPAMMMITPAGLMITATAATSRAGTNAVSENLVTKDEDNNNVGAAADTNANTTSPPPRPPTPSKTPPTPSNSAAAQEKVVIMFEFEGRKLKLTTVAHKVMRKAMGEFCKHRRLEVGRVEFRCQETGALVEEEGVAATYGGKVVSVTNI